MVVLRKTLLEVTSEPLPTITEWGYELGSEVEEMGKSIMDKIMGTAAVNEDDGIVTRNRTQDAKGDGCGLAG